MQPVWSLNIKVPWNYIGVSNVDNTHWYIQYIIELHAKYHGIERLCFDLIYQYRCVHPPLTNQPTSVGRHKLTLLQLVQRLRPRSRWRESMNAPSVVKQPMSAALTETRQNCAIHLCINSRIQDKRFMLWGTWPKSDLWMIYSFRLLFPGIVVDVVK